MQPRSNAQGWQLVSSCVADTIQPPPGSTDDAWITAVEFGPFLGAGSYGRFVYSVCICVCRERGVPRAQQQCVPRKLQGSNTLLSCCLRMLCVSRSQGVSRSLGWPRRGRQGYRA
jgi:hypothetical protein